MVFAVILPEAIPGIVAACLLGLSRALGETMIVVMAASLRPINFKFFRRYDNGNGKNRRSFKWRSSF